MLRVKRTFNRTSAVKYSLMVNLTPHHFASSRNMISKDSKYFNFISLTFVGPTYIAKIGACSYQIVNTPSGIGSGRYCNRSLGVRAQWFFILCPPNVLTGPLFLNRGVPGDPKLKDKILVRTLSKYDRKSIISYKWPLVPFQVWPLRSICKSRIIVFPCFFAPHFFFFFTPCLLCCVVLFFFFSCR